MKFNIRLLILLCALTTLNITAQAQKNGYVLPVQVKTVNGIVEGEFDVRSNIHTFKGIPYAQPPVGDLRWKEPQPVKNWTGVLETKQFGPKAVQPAIFGDMGFRSNGMSEDCLYLNVWTPKVKTQEKMPVLVYFYGGGFIAGDGSEPRYDGESMSKKGIVTVTLNYRLGIFSFFSHPELTKESPNKASGNYGYLDQSAALRWVKANIANFGGDPNKITIAGESAGSVSVSAQMVSPLSRNLIAGAIGESGGLVFPTLAAVSLQEGEKTGTSFAQKAGVNSLKELRAMTTYEVYQKMMEFGVWNFKSTLDGYFLPKTLPEVYASKEHANVPLLVGWNSEEMNYKALTKGKEATPEVYTNTVKELYGEKAEEVLKLYPVGTAEETEQSATALAGDRFIAFSTWKWFDAHRKNSNQPVYRYFYAHPRPDMKAQDVEAALAGGVVKRDKNAPKAPKPKGAVHSAEIEYAMGNLGGNATYDWNADDYKVSETMQNYFANFIKTGNPNGAGLENWPVAKDEANPDVMIIKVQSKAIKTPNDNRYLFLDKEYQKK